MKTTSPNLRALRERIILCRSCPRLVDWRETVAREKVRRFRDETYWGKPVPGFGDPQARIVIVGLAPAAHGANRTGRVFTGDRSGEFLFAALHGAGIASVPESRGPGDGLVLRDAYVLCPVRCAPPGNRPTRDEIARCAPFFVDELAALENARVLLALGAIAWTASVRAAHALAGQPVQKFPKFGHGARTRVPEDERGLWLVGSYHVSQQNTQTGRLTPTMFDRVLRDVRALVESGRKV